MATDKHALQRAQWHAVLLIAFSAGVIYVAWRWLGIVGILLSSPLLGLAFARPILSLFGLAHRFARTQALHDVQGRHFEHRGNLIDVADDGEGYRWLRIDDVRKVIANLPGDAVLQRLYPDDVSLWPAPPACRIKAEALLKYLEKSSDPASLKFRNWIAGEVVMPADKRRQR